MRSAGQRKYTTTRRGEENIRGGMNKKWKQKKADMDYTEDNTFRKHLFRRCRKWSRHMICTKMTPRSNRN